MTFLTLIEGRELERVLRTVAFCPIDALIVNIAYFGAFFLDLMGLYQRVFDKLPTFVVSATIIMIFVYLCFRLL